MQNKDYIILKWKLKNNKEETWIRVSGSSMFPILENEDMVLLQKDDKYVMGDILVYIYNDKLIIHRCISVNTDVYVCRGDNSRNDERISSEAIVGRVIMLEKGEKRFQFINGTALRLLLKVRYNLENVISPKIIERNSLSLFIRKFLICLISKCNVKEVV